MTIGVEMFFFNLFLNWTMRIEKLTLVTIFYTLNVQSLIEIDQVMSVKMMIYFNGNLRASNAKMFKTFTT